MFKYWERLESANKMPLQTPGHAEGCDSTYCIVKFLLCLTVYSLKACESVQLDFDSFFSSQCWMRAA